MHLNVTSRLAVVTSPFIVPAVNATAKDGAFSTVVSGQLQFVNVKLSRPMITSPAPPALVISPSMVEPVQVYEYDIPPPSSNLNSSVLSSVALNAVFSAYAFPSH